MAQLKSVESHRCYGGTQSVVEHASESTGSSMRLGVFQPDGPGPFPALFFLSGLTCTEQNFITKGQAQRFAAEAGLLLIAPDTSPRGLAIPGADDEGDFGSGASFYVDATESPWAAHYRMYSYVTQELPALVRQHLPVGGARLGITGHSMGGHGALVCGIRNPNLFHSVSAFAPICAPSHCAWGRKAFSGYLGENEQAWKDYDSCELIARGGYGRELLVDVGSQDPFLAQQLLPKRLEEACRQRGVPLSLREQPGYDHSYYFVSTFIEDHVRFHAERLRG